MFCQKCWREIPEDSAFCAYCGVIIPPEERVLDWEEAERMREEALRKIPTNKRNFSSAARGDCVIPGAERKQCLKCGKSLPASTIGDYCALCTMRLEQEEAQKISDARDWATQPKPDTAYQRTGTVKKVPREDAAEIFAKKKAFSGIVGAMVVLAVIFGAGKVLFSLSSILDTIDFGTTESTAVAEVVPVSESPDQYPISWEGYDWTPLDSDTPILQELDPDLTELLISELGYYGFPNTFQEIDEDSLQWSTCGAYTRVQGNFFTEDDEENVYLDTFDMVLITVETSVGYEPSIFALSISDMPEYVYDSLYLISLDGTLTPEGAEAFDLEPYTNIGVIALQ